MRYNSIEKCEVTNGKGVGVSLFVQGCPIHCKGCFNKETWDFDGGKEWTTKISEKFIEYASKPYIQRISILGGEPFASYHYEETIGLINYIRLRCPDKKIWVYSGYSFKTIFTSGILDDLKLADVLVAGPFIEEQKDLTLAFRGSRNQEIIDIQESLKQHREVLYME